MVELRCRSTRAIPSKTPPHPFPLRRVTRRARAWPGAGDPLEDAGKVRAAHGAAATALMTIRTDSRVHKSGWVGEIFGRGGAQCPVGSGPLFRWLRVSLLSRENIRERNARGRAWFAMLLLAFCMAFNARVQHVCTARAARSTCACHAAAFSGRTDPRPRPAAARWGRLRWRPLASAPGSLLSGSTISSLRSRGSGWRCVGLGSCVAGPCPPGAALAAPGGTGRGVCCLPLRG